MASKRLFRLFTSFFAMIPTICTIAFVTVVLLLAVNFVAEKYLQKYPELLLSKEEQINLYARKNIDAGMPKDKALLWYDLKTSEQVRQMWDEYYQSYNMYEPYTQFRSTPLIGKFYKCTEEGYRMTRDPGPWPPSPDYYNVFFFGGSTSFHIGPAWAATASHLQDVMNQSGRFNRKVYVYNFGRSSYAFTQERILFQQLLRDGLVPDMAVFMDGLNDFTFFDGKPSGWQMLSNMYDSFHKEFSATAMANGIRTPWHQLRDFLKKTPLCRLASAMSNRVTAKDLPQYHEIKKDAVVAKPENEKTLRAVIERYVQNMKQVEVVSKAYHVTPIFVWQPVPTYKYDLQYHFLQPKYLPNCVNLVPGYPMMAEYVKTHPMGDHFIWAADMQENLKENLYIDSVHYTSPMARRIAELIVERLPVRL